MFYISLISSFGDFPLLLVTGLNGPQVPGSNAGGIIATGRVTNARKISIKEVKMRKSTTATSDPEWSAAYNLQSIT